MLTTWDMGTSEVGADGAIPCGSAGGIISGAPGTGYGAPSGFFFLNMSIIGIVFNSFY